MKGICAVYRLGLMDYKLAWKKQGELASEIAAGTHPPSLLLLEHPHTFTFGRRGQLKHLLWSEEELRHRKVSVHWVDRGGDVTYHGPGQLVGYPLLRLDNQNLLVQGDSTRLPQADYVGYVRNLEQVLIRALMRFGLATQRETGLTGVWVPQKSSRDGDPAKIAAIGVKVDAGGVTRHGFALNINPDMSYWEGIIGCGLVGHPVTCLADWLQPVPTTEAVIREVIQAFGEVYGYQMETRTL